MKGVIQKEFWLLFYILVRYVIRSRPIIANLSNKRDGKILQSEVVIETAIRKKQDKAKILFINQRPSAKGGPSPFEGPTSYPQLCWWSLIGSQKMNVLCQTPERLLLIPVDIVKGGADRGKRKEQDIEKWD